MAFPHVVLLPVTALTGSQVLFSHKQTEDSFHLRTLLVIV